MSENLTKISEKEVEIIIKPDIFRKEKFVEYLIPIINSFEKDNIIEIKSPSLNKSLFVRAKTSDILNAEEIFINGDYDQTVPFPVQTIIDAGANIGLSARFFAEKYPESRILSLEPESSNFEILKKNIQSYTNIISLNKALWKDNSNLHISNKNKTDKWGFMVDSSETEDCNIQSLTVFDCLKILECETIDLFKIDIEGSEKEIFSENTEWLSRVRFLIIELHEKMREGSTDSFNKAISQYDFEDLTLKGKYAKHMRVLINKNI